MATHSSTFAWEILWTREPGGLPSMGMQRFGYNLATQQQQFDFQFSLVQSLSCVRLFATP